MTIILSFRDKLSCRSIVFVLSIYLIKFLTPQFSTRYASLVAFLRSLSVQMDLYLFSILGLSVI
jgi:hypothetical protein